MACADFAVLTRSLASDSVRQKVWDQLKAYNERRGDRPKALWHHLKVCLQRWGFALESDGTCV